MTTPINGIVRSAIHALDSRQEQWGPLKLYQECLRIAPKCRHVMQRRVRRVLERMHFKRLRKQYLEQMRDIQARREALHQMGQVA